LGSQGDSSESRKIGMLKRLVLRTPCETVAQVVERYHSYLHEGMFILPKPGLFPPGTIIELELHLKGGQPALRGRAQVEEQLAGRPGTPVRFKAMDGASRGVLRQMLERGQAPPAVAASTGYNRQVLTRMLEQMELVEEKFGDPGQSVSNGRAPKGMVLGIDLGTTNSCCAVIKDGKPFVIPSRRGHRTIPSVVAVDPTGQVVVGHAAKAQMEINPSKTVYGSKRLVGRPYESPIVRQVRDRFHYQIVPAPDGRAAVKIDDQVLSLEKVASLILNEIRDVAQDYLGKVIMRAVITVPAYYNENQRSAVRAAGQLAGLHVERILNEPTAAALAYGYQRRKDQKILVYDLGGGTFDATVLQVQGNRFEVLATGGDTFLGGVDFDTQLMDHIIIEFQLQLGKLPHMERVALLRAMQGAEFAKCALSSREQYQVRLPFIGTVDDKPVDLEVAISREQLEQLVEPLVDKTMDACEQVLAQANVSPAELDAILLVGGQTRMPLIWTKIEQRFGKQPLKGVHPDESVAVGAALLADSIDSLEAVVLVDVLPMTIGVGVPGGKFYPLIDSGTRVPVSRTYSLHTFLDNQRELLLPVYQGEGELVDENEYLGTVHIRGIPPGPPGSRTIDISFSLSPECLLTVKASDRQAGELTEVLMTTRDTPESLSKKLGLDIADVPDLPEQGPAAVAHEQSTTGAASREKPKPTAPGEKPAEPVPPPDPGQPPAPANPETVPDTLAAARVPGVVERLREWFRRVFRR